MKGLTIQARLTLWFFLSFALVVGLLCTGSWFAVKFSMYHAIDRNLEYRLAALVPFLESRQVITPEQYASIFAPGANLPIAGFVQISSASKGILYQSAVMRVHGLTRLPAAPADGTIRVETLGHRGWPIRVASQLAEIDGDEISVHAIEPMPDLMEALRGFRIYLAISIPLALLLTTTLGSLLSRQALAPVENIRQEADAIDPADLSARLRVPKANDELSRLTHTLNAMLQRIELSMRSVRQFTADASHELRAPLAFILTAAEVTLRRERSADELKAVLQKVVREARRMSALVEDLLTLARADGQQAPRNLEAVALKELLTDLASSFASVAADRNLELHLQLPEETLLASGLPSELRRLFVILLDNAVKYTEAGHIHLTLERRGQQVAIAVSDTGIGIAPEALPYVFDRFWRADEVRSRAEGGSGLGLSLAKQIVRNCGGQIAVTSQPEQGSTFTVLLNLASGLRAAE